jgi:hypothetical protein
MGEKFEVREMPRQARLDVARTLHHMMLRGIELVFLYSERQKGAAKN